MLLGQAALAVEVILEKRDVRLGGVGFREELGIGGDAHRRGLDLSKAAQHDKTLNTRRKYSAKQRTECIPL